MHARAPVHLTAYRIHGRAVCLLIGLLACAGCSRQASLETARTFQRAQDVFDQAQSPDDYLKAAAIYESIREDGVVSGAVLYNQGNAYMRAGQRGRAIAAYREAIRYRPRDPYLAANLMYALDSDTISSGSSLLEYVLFWQNWLGYREKYVLAFVAGLLTFALAVAGLWLAGRRVWIWSAVAGLVLTGVFMVSAAYDWYRYERVVQGVIVTGDVTARKGYGQSYEPAFADPLAEGTEFTLQERRGEWLRIRLAGNKDGWVENHDVVLY